MERVGYCRARTVEAEEALPHQHSIEVWLTAAAELAFSAVVLNWCKEQAHMGDANVDQCRSCCLSSPGRLSPGCTSTAVALSQVELRGTLSPGRG